MLKRAGGLGVWGGGKGGFQQRNEPWVIQRESHSWQIIYLLLYLTETGLKKNCPVFLSKNFKSSWSRIQSPKLRHIALFWTHWDIQTSVWSCQPCRQEDPCHSGWTQLFQSEHWRLVATFAMLGHDARNGVTQPLHLTSSDGTDRHWSSGK